MEGYDARGSLIPQKYQNQMGGAAGGPSNVPHMSGKKTIVSPQPGAGADAYFPIQNQNQQQQQPQP